MQDAAGNNDLPGRTRCLFDQIEDFAQTIKDGAGGCPQDLGCIACLS
jgi:hypothetical protein